MCVCVCAYILCLNINLYMNNGPSHRFNSCVDVVSFVYNVFSFMPIFTPHQSKHNVVKQNLR